MKQQIFVIATALTFAQSAHYSDRTSHPKVYPNSSGRLYFEALAAHFATHVILALLSQPEITTQVIKLPERTFDHLLEFVEASLSEDLSLSALAEVVGMPPSQFVRWFKVKVGQSPHAWVITFRLNRAKTLLANTEQPIPPKLLLTVASAVRAT